MGKRVYKFTQQQQDLIEENAGKTYKEISKIAGVCMSALSFYFAKRKKTRRSDFLKEMLKVKPVLPPPPMKRPEAKYSNPNYSTMYGL